MCVRCVRSLETGYRRGVLSPLKGEFAIEGSRGHVGVDGVVSTCMRRGECASVQIT
jgi:hypothetical protein